MLKSLTSSLATFKEVTFSPGLNIAVATTKKKSKKDSRNSVGKSSMVNLIDYCLASDVGKQHLTMHPRLLHETFRLELSLGSSIQYLSRTSEDPKFPFHNGARTELAVLRQFLGRELFGLSGIANQPSFRAAVAFYIRQRQGGGFLNPLRTHSRQSDVETATAVTYLLNLDSSITSQAKELKKARKGITALNAATKNPIFGRVVTKVSELDAEIGTLRVSMELLEKDLRNFKVVDQYAIHVRRADNLSKEIREINDNLVILEQKVSDVLEALKAEDADQPDHTYLEQIYREIGLALPSSALRSFDDVAAFHASVVKNRQTYLARELSEAYKEIEVRKATLSKLDGDRAETMLLLQEGGALETFTELQNKHTRALSRLSELKEKKLNATALSNARSYVASQEFELKERTRMDIGDRSLQIDEIGDFFTRLAFKIYASDRTASLSILDSTSGYQLIPTISGDRGGGVANITLFCFDLTLAVMAKRAGHGPDFLIHDSHLFDGVEERQIGAALRVASEVCEKEGLQYITALNTDVLSGALTHESDIHFNTAVTLTDEYESGGLFGIRFD